MVRKKIDFNFSNLFHKFFNFLHLEEFVLVFLFPRTPLVSPPLLFLVPPLGLRFLRVTSRRLSFLYLRTLLLRVEILVVLLPVLYHLLPLHHAQLVSLCELIVGAYSFVSALVLQLLQFNA